MKPKGQDQTSLKIKRKMVTNSHLVFHLMDKYEYDNRAAVQYISGCSSEELDYLYDEILGKT